MSDLSVRFMGTSHEKLQRTVQLNRGLGPVTGRVPTLNFPQGKFRQGKTPKVSKNKVHHLHRASICEVVFTDTFETGDYKYAYGQAFVDWLVSAEGQKAIADYKIGGQSLFFPNATQPGA
jgi:hypothetical protein